MNLNQCLKTLCIWLAGLLPGITAQAQTFMWVQPSYSKGDGNLYGLTLSNGNLIATGSFQQQLSFGSITLADPIGYATALTGSFFSVTGSPNWLKQSLNPQSPNTVVQGGASCADSAGNIYVAYYTSDNVQFDQVLVPATTPTIVLVQYSAAGTINWAKAFHSSSSSTLSYPIVDYKLTAAGGNNIHLSISFKGQLTSGSTTYNNAGAPLATLVLKLDNAGDTVWAKELSGASISAISGDSSGNLLAAGHFDSQLALGSTLSFNGTNGHLFVAKYSSSGSLQWAQQMGGQANDAINGLTTDASGNVAFCGYFGNIGNGMGYATATFGPTTLATVGNYGQPAGFVAKYSAQGSYQWVKGIYNPNDATTQAQRIVSSAAGDFYVSGFAAYGTQFGAFTAGGNGSYDGFVAKYGPTGTEQWLTTFGSAYNEIYAGYALAIDSQGYLYVGGSFVGTAQFGSLSASGAYQVYTPYLAQLRDDQVLSTHPVTVSASSFQLFPNPSAGPVRISWPLGLHPVGLSILDMLGRTVQEYAVTSTSAEQMLNLANVSPGVYLVRLQTTTQGVLTQRLVLR